MVTKEIIKNPFLVSGYHSPAYFCDREKESRKVISALQNGRNISLISPRRIGKTGLIHHVFYLLKQQDKTVKCFYLDIFHTQSLTDFVNLLATTVLGQLDYYSTSILKQITTIFKSIRPQLSFDEVTGSPSLSVEIKPSQEEKSLKEIFDYLQHSHKICYIAIDEFQQITEYPQKGVEALLRSHIQFLPNVKFIFSGSKKHLMDIIFSDTNRPFYQSTDKIGLSEIACDTYSKFAIHHFKNGNKVLSENVFEYIYNMMIGHTWYIQSILNRLYLMDKKRYTNGDVDFIVSDILEEENATYKTYCEIITKGQLNLLIAIAKERKVESLYELSFLKKYNLKALSSVKQAVQSLAEKTLILKDEENKYFVYDRFFSLWLEKYQ